MMLSKSWMKERGDSSYIEGVQQFVKFVKDNAAGEVLFTCPCLRCKNSKGHIELDTIGYHLLKYGIDPSYVVWDRHGEKMVESLTPMVVDECAFPKLDELVNDIFIEHSGDEADLCNDVTMAQEESDPTSDVEHKVKESVKYIKFMKMATEPLYHGCPAGKTTLSTIVELQNLKTRYGWSSNSVTDLLDWLKGLFSEECTFPKNYPQMKNIVKELGMECETIHACKNGCILYRKDYAQMKNCPKCGVSRYKVVMDTDVEKNKRFKKEPAKFVKYFPLIPRLRRYFSIPWIAEAMTWHRKAKSDGNLMRHPCDSGQWDMINLKFPHFSSDARNLRLAISTDGFNPYGSPSLSYSCWPVILAPLNLPPSLCMKREFSLLTLLISGPKGPGKNIDVFLEPLIDELKELWDDGVLTWDAFTKTTFTLRAMLLWGIHDLPAYGTLSGCTVHGYKSCPVCADDVHSERLDDSNKICFRDYRIFLRPGHKYRYDTKFNNCIEERPPPKRLSGEEVEKRASQVADSSIGSTVNAPSWSRRSILFDLPYWKFIDVRHNIDVMHTEKNVTDHLLNLLMGVVNKTKDGLKARKDMQALGINKKLWLVEDEETGKTSMPKASYTLTKKEKQEFCQSLKNLKLPTGFSSNLSNLVTVKPPELRGLKSHDYHVIMQQLLPVLLKHTFKKNNDLRIAIHRISLFFNIVCAKVINKEDLLLAKRALVEAMCVLEKELPPSFFVISVHCMIHLADEALACGPVRFRWMYSTEQLLKGYKECTLNKRYVEGSISEAYLAEESVMYCMEYMPDSNFGTHKSGREAWWDENDGLLDEEPMQSSGTFELNNVQYQQVRRWVFNRLADVGTWKSKYIEYSKRLCSFVEFIPWLCDELLKVGETDTALWRLANGPSHKATTYKKYRVNGFVFAPSSSDEQLVTQDSGVSMKAYADCVAGSKDKKPKEGLLTFYGIVRDILELDYIDFKETLFYCDWVKVEDSKNGCKVDPSWNLVMVNLNKLKNREKLEEDPFILAQEAYGVFYSKDREDNGWHVVLHMPKRLSKEVDMIDIPNKYQSILNDNPKLRNLLKFDD